MKDETRRMILTGIFVAAIGCLISIFFMGIHLANEKQQTPEECKQEIMDYLHSVELTSLSWDSSDDPLATQLHGNAFLNQKIKECGLR